VRGLESAAGAGRPAQRIYAVAAVFALALIAAFLFPRLDFTLNPGAGQPGLITYLGVGLSVLALTAGMLFAGLRGVLPKTAVFLASALGYNAMLLLIKFALGPMALYTYSPPQGYLTLSGSGGFIAFPALAAIAGILYAGAFFFIYLYFRSDLRRRLAIPVRFETRFVNLLVVMFVLAVAGGVTLVGALGFLEYLTALLSMAGIALVLALALVLAIVLCTVAFREATEQAVLLRNVTLLSGFAWVGLAFIAAYHIVWVVFALTLISLWPLKSFTGK
jgi:hypothetical protein